MNSVIETSVSSVVKSRIYTIDDILGRREPDAALNGKFISRSFIDLDSLDGVPNSKMNNRSTRRRRRRRRRDSVASGMCPTSGLICIHFATTCWSGFLSLPDDEYANDALLPNLRHLL